MKITPQIMGILIMLKDENTFISLNNLTKNYQSLNQL